MKKLITTAVLLTAVSAQAEVTYEQILMDPDNVSLNQAYVRERLAAGDLSQALVSVERIILLQPLNMDARVARAQILMRLGNMTSAKQELDALDALPLGDRLSAQVDELLAEVEAQQQRWSVLGSVSFGFSSDDNVGNHTDTGRTADASGLDNGAFIDSEGFDSQRSDEQAFVSASITASYDLGNQTSDSLYYSLRVGGTVGNDSELKDNKTAGLSLGAKFNRSWANSQVYINWDTTRRDDLTNKDDPTNPVKQDDVDTLSAGISLSQQVGNTTLSGGVSYADADFSGRDAAVSDRNDAATSSINAGLFTILSDSLALSVSAGFEEREADKPSVTLAEETQNREAISAGGSLIWQSAPGHRWTLGAQVKKLDYEKQLSTDQFVRDDTQTTYSLSYTLFGAVVDPSLKDWSLSLGGSRTQVDSNMITYDVTNNRYNATLNYRFGR